MIFPEDVAGDVDGMPRAINQPTEMLERIHTAGNEFHMVPVSRWRNTVGPQNPLNPHSEIGVGSGVGDIVDARLPLGHAPHLAPADHQIERNSNVRQKHDRQEPSDRARWRPRYRVV